MQKKSDGSYDAEKTYSGSSNNRCTRNTKSKESPAQSFEFTDELLCRLEGENSQNITPSAILSLI